MPLSLPSYYDLRDEGRVTPVGDQQQCGCCWAFATYASQESYLRPGETLDFSENNLKNLHGFDNDKLCRKDKPFDLQSPPTFSLA